LLVGINGTEEQGLFMATKKKTSVRRVPHSTTPRTFSDGQPITPVAEAENGAPVATQAAPVRSSTLDSRRRVAVRSSEARPQLPLSEEYAYVPKDLKRLGILALGMVGIMVVLGVIVH
jgi:hypothetical protein